MILAGIWRLEICNKKLQVIYNVYVYIVQIYFYFYICFRIIGLITFFKDCDWKAGGTSAIYTMIMCVGYLKCLSLRSKGVQKVIRLLFALENDIYANGDETDINIYEESARSNTRRNVIYFAAISAIAFVMLGLPLVFKEDVGIKVLLRAFFFGARLPIDTARHKVLEFVCRAFGVMVICMYFTGSGLFSFTLLSFCVSNLKILQRRLENVSKKISQSNHENAEKIVLEDCIIHHRSIIR